MGNEGETTLSFGRGTSLIITGNPNVRGGTGRGQGREGGDREVV